jgi:hypothetical protein
MSGLWRKSIVHLDGNAHIWPLAGESLQKHNHDAKYVNYRRISHRVAPFGKFALTAFLAMSAQYPVQSPQGRTPHA